MKTLIAILSCHSLRSNEQSVRETWIKDIPQGVDYKFFLGNPDIPVLDDEVVLNVEDSIEYLSLKVREACRWALSYDYDFLFKCDLDTLVRPVLLMQSGFEKHDYSGGHYVSREFASGGSGYWLSKKSMGIVVDEVKEEEPWEDVYVARALLRHGIEVHDNPQHKFMPGAMLDERTIAIHLSSVKGWGEKATPEDMYRVYNEKPRAKALRRPPR